MKVMILAAGRGQRMGALTTDCPKPLLKVSGLSLIEHVVKALKRDGFKEFVINVAYLGNQIKQYMGSGEKWGVHIDYSDEGDAPLETGGGVQRALPLLGNEPFLLVNADVWTDFPFQTLRNKTKKRAHLVLVDNPSHNLNGDFFLLKNEVTAQGKTAYTYSGIGVYHPDFFAGQSAGAFRLAPLIRQAVLENDVSGELYQGCWVDVGTPERLASIQQ